MGGSSGAAALNEWTWKYLDELTKIANVIHLTGVDKASNKVPSPFQGEGRPKALRSLGEGGVRVG